jgi:hypothetical protein
MNGTNSDESFAHGLTGGAPDALLFFSAIHNSTPPSSVADALFAVGAHDGTSSFAACVRSEDVSSTSDTKRTLRTTSALGFIGLPGTYVRSFDVSASDATNVDVTYVETASTFAPYFFMLALRGCKAQVGTFDCNGSTDPLTISTPGITPKLFLPVVLRAGVSNINAVMNGVLLAIGASDGTNTVSCGITDEDSQTTTDTRRFQSSSAIEEFNVSGTKRFSSSVSFGSQNVQLTPTQNFSGYGQGAYLIIGN